MTRAAPLAVETDVVFDLGQIGECRRQAFSVDVVEAAIAPQEGTLGAAQRQVECPTPRSDALCAHVAARVVSRVLRRQMSLSGIGACATVVTRATSCARFSRSPPTFERALHISEDHILVVGHLVTAVCSGRGSARCELLERFEVSWRRGFSRIGTHALSRDATSVDFDIEALEHLLVALNVGQTLLLIIRDL